MKLISTSMWPKDFLDGLFQAVEEMRSNPEKITDIHLADEASRRDSYKSFFEEYHFRYCGHSWSIMRVQPGDYFLYFYPPPNDDPSVIAKAERPDNAERFDGKNGIGSVSCELRDLLSSLYYTVRLAYTGADDAVADAVRGILKAPKKEDVPQTPTTAVESIVDTIIQDSGDSGDSDSS